MENGGIKLINYKNSNERYVANYILYGFIQSAPDTDDVILPYHDSDMEHAVTAKEFETMFYGAPVYVRLFEDGAYADAIITSFSKSEDDAAGFVIIFNEGYRIVFNG